VEGLTPGVYFTGLLVGVCHKIFDIHTFPWIRSLLGPDYRVDVFDDIKVAKIFLIFDASPVSTTPVKNTTAATLILLRITIPVSSTPL
jgi:hypothetical protein